MATAALTPPDAFIVVTCGSCGTKLRTRVTAGGRTAKCPKCSALLRIELPAAAAPASPPPPPPPAIVDPPDFEQTTTMFEPSDVSDPPEMPVPVPAPMVAATPAVVPARPPEVAPVSAPESDPAPVASTEPSFESESSSEAVTPVTPPATGGILKTFILTSAAAFIGAFAWYLTDRFAGGGAQWIVKFSCVAFLMGMGTATAVIGGSGRRGPGANVAAALAGMSAIALGKLLVVALVQLPQVTGGATDAAQVIRLVTASFGYVDPLFFAVAAVGSAVRFILARP